MNNMNKDLSAVCKGIIKICQSSANIRYDKIEKIYLNYIKNPSPLQLPNDLKSFNKIDNASLKELTERMHVVIVGGKTFINRDIISTKKTSSSIDTDIKSFHAMDDINEPPKKYTEKPDFTNTSQEQFIFDTEMIDDKLAEVHNKILNQNIKILRQSEQIINEDSDKRYIQDVNIKFGKNSIERIINEDSKNSILLEFSESTFKKKNDKELIISEDKQKPDINLFSHSSTKSKKKPISKGVASTLSDVAQPKKVPQSQVGRLFSFGQLAVRLGLGTAAEMTRRALGATNASSSPFMTEDNAKRIVETLCKVRGAALKLGQMLSIQDASLINPTLQKMFERVRQSADFMPQWQLERILVDSLGSDWKNKVASFDTRPFAAASIGQVHQAVLHDGRTVAMKIQYPGVANSIESDINNLVGTLKLANIFPEGLYVDQAITVAKRELAWECDYEREKYCAKRYGDMMRSYPDYYVPEVIDELCTSQILTSELIDGIPVDKCIDLDQDTRNRICELIMKLCLLEIFQYRFMQTDPNWSNFFYNQETKQITLLDFGACREYSKQFVDDYINVIHGAAHNDRSKVLEYSSKLNFLTGCEAKVMENAHIDAVMILGEAFQKHEPFDFGAQDTTHRIQTLIPVMLKHRMCPPPEESYSLHRKISGVFLLCTKLKGVIQCKPFFDHIYENYQFGEEV